MTRRGRVRPVLLTSLVFLASPANACSLCHTSTAVAVRAAVLGPDLFTNLFALTAPVPVFVLAVLLLRRAVA